MLRSKPPVEHDDPAERLAAACRQLAQRVSRHSPHDGVFPLRVQGSYVVRRSRPYHERVHAVQRPSLCVVAQGAKRILAGPDVFDYDASQLIVFSLEMPISAQVLQASQTEPYLGFVLALDPHVVARLALRAFPHGIPRPEDPRAIGVAPNDPVLLEAVNRLVDTASDPREAELLAPLIIDEILLRLLCGPAGGRVANIATQGSGAHGVAQAVSWLTQHYSQPLRVDSLARVANMSSSTFHQHFKAVTSLSPLQFQKALRLTEARRLLLSQAMDAGVASRQVGYSSPSQFSREYNRYFGQTPSRDMARLHADLQRQQDSTIEDLSS